jgi:fibronectin-binding autotransporter adhesin
VSILRSVIVPLGVICAAASASAALVLSPGDSIVGGQLGTNFTVGNTGSAGNTWPLAEAPQYVIDGTKSKYLNFAGMNTGFMVTPLFDGGAGSVISSMQLWTANDSPERDPGSYRIYGTNDNLTANAGPGTVFNLSSFTLIATGNLALPTGRNLNALDVANSQTVAFANTASYKQYLVVFPTLRSVTNTLMQIGEVQFSGVKSSDLLTWTGSTDGNWNLATSNWITAGGVAASYHDLTALTFNDSPTVRNIAIQNGGGAVQPASLTFVHNTGSYTIGGDAISSAGTLSLIGMGEVILANLNNFTTGTVVNAGTLTVMASGSLGSGPLTVNSQSAGGGQTSKVALGAPHSIASLAGTVSGTNAASLVLSGTLTVNQANNADFQGIISGAGGLTKNGPATLNLTAQNTYQGPTTINSGILQSSRVGDDAFSALPAGQPVTVNAGAMLVLGAVDNTQLSVGAIDGLGYYEGKVASLTVNGGTVLANTNSHHTLPPVTLNGGTLTGVDGGHVSSGVKVNYIFDGSVTTIPDGGTSYIKAAAIRLRGKTDEFSAVQPVVFTVPRGSTATDLVVTSQIQDVASGLTKNGDGIMVLGNISTATGPTLIQNGTLQLHSTNGLGSGQVTIQSGAKLSLAPVAALSGFSDVSLNGGATLNGNTSVTLTDGIGSEARSVFSNTPISVTNGFTASWTYTTNGGADGTAFILQSVSPSVVGAAGGGLGYQGLANAAGLLYNIYQSSGTAFSSNGTIPVYTTAGFTFSTAPVNVTVVYDPVAGTLVETLAGAATITRSFSGVNLSTILGNAPAFIGFSGGTGGVTSTQSISNFSLTTPAQALNLANAVVVSPTATAGLEILASKPGTPGAATFSGTFTVNAGATVNLTGGDPTTNTAYLLTVTGTTSVGVGVTLDVSNTGTAVGAVSLGDVAGLTPDASLTKRGPGTLTILGVASYGGATAVNGGTMVVNGSISGETTINAGGTLTGNGTLAAVTINGNAFLAPGNGIGSVHTGPLSLKDGSTLILDMNANTADAVLVNGAITLAGTIELAISLAADPVDGAAFTILDGNAPLVGYSANARFSFFGSPIDQGVEFEVPGNGFSQRFTIDYGVQDVVLRAVPEPATTTVMLGGLAALAGVRRRLKVGGNLRV